MRKTILSIRMYDGKKEFNLNYHLDTYDNAKTLADIIRYICFYFNLVCEIQVVENAD